MATAEPTPMYNAVRKETRKDPKRIAQRSRDRISKIMRDVNGS